MCSLFFPLTSKIPFFSIGREADEKNMFTRSLLEAVDRQPHPFIVFKQKKMSMSFIQIIVPIEKEGTPEKVNGSKSKTPLLDSSLPKQNAGKNDEVILFRNQQRFGIEFQLEVDRNGRIFSLNQVQLDKLLFETESDQDIDLIQTAFYQKRNTFLVEQGLLTFERGAEPDFEAEANRELFEFGQIIRTIKRKIETVDDDRISLKLAVNDHGFEAFEDLIRLGSFLLEIHDDPVPDDLVMDIHRSFQLPFFGDFLENIFVPVDDVVHTAGIGNVDNGFVLKQLVGGHMN
jgi:hypothetical protein